MKTIKILILTLLMGNCMGYPPAFSQKNTEKADSSIPDSITIARTQWFRDARLGMFIHWGLYAIPAGIWNGKPVFDKRFPNPYCEHVMWLNKVPITEYSQLAKRFNPTAFDANLIVKMAKNAGMKYIVITAKHHEGFAMYKSSHPYNIVDATPYKKDVLKALGDVCKKEGIVLGVYYSLGRDWYEKDAVARQSNNWDFLDTVKRDYQKYLDNKVKPQLTEILTNYGPIGFIWFDTPEQTSLAQSNELASLVKTLQPNCLINTRVGNKIGDIVEMDDNRVPSGGLDKPWESPCTMAESWGYSVLDTKEYWKSSETLIKKLVDIASKGGNYLLNIGPDSLGRVPELAVTRLNDIGRWMNYNGEAIYYTTASKLPLPDFGRYTQNGNIIYAFIFDWPGEQTLLVPIAASKVKNVELLTVTGTVKLNYRATQGTGMIIELPAKKTSLMVPVIKIIKAE